MKNLRTQFGKTTVDGRRRAFSIVELLVVVALTSFIFGLTISFIHAMLLAGRKLRDRPATVEQFARLADDLRADVRRARNVSRADEKRLDIQLTENAHAVYELTEGGCRRSGVPADTAGADAEFYSIGGASAWQVELKPSARHELIEITLRADADSQSQTSAPPLWMVSALGVDRAAASGNK